MSDLVTYLNRSLYSATHVLNAPVVDATGLGDSSQEIWLNVPTEINETGRGGRIHLDAIPALLEPQLGLKLQPGKARLEYLVVTHVARPAPN